MKHDIQSSRRRLVLLLVVGLLAVVVAAGSMAYRVLRLTRQAARQDTATVDDMLREKRRLQREVARLERISAEQDRVLLREKRRLQQLRQQAPGGGSGGPASRPAGAIDPKAAAALLRRSAREELAAGRHHNARELARNSLVHDPGNPEALQIMGAAACHLDDADTAREAHRQLDRERQARLRALCSKVGRVRLPQR
jgi:hypothetical protein